MNLNLLTTFVTIVEEGNFSKAALKLHLSQPAVSMQMQTLATELEVNLFLRVGKKVQLTEAGTLLYGQGKKILANWNDIVTELDAYKTKVSGKLRIGASTIPGQYFLPKELKNFQASYPNAQLTIVIKDSHDIMEDLLTGNLDVAFVGKRINKSGISCCRWKMDRLVMIKGKELDVDNKLITATDLKDIPFVSRKEGSGTRNVIEEKLKKEGLRLEDLKIALELDNTENIIAAVEAGIGVSMVSEVAAKRGVMIGNIEIIPTTIEVEREIYYAFRHDQLKSNVLENFLSFLNKGGE